MVRQLREFVKNSDHLKPKFERFRNMFVYFKR